MTAPSNQSSAEYIHKLLYISLISRRCRFIRLRLEPLFDEERQWAHDQRLETLDACLECTVVEIIWHYDVEFLQDSS